MTTIRAGRTRTAWATALILAAGSFLSLLLNLPGHLSFDSVIQLSEGRSAVYGNWHPPVMSFLLGVFDALIPGTGLFVAFDTLLLFLSMMSLLWLKPVPRWTAVVAAVFCVLTPQFLLYQGIVWKDVLFADALLAGFVALACAASLWGHGRIRVGCLVLGAVFIVLAVLARQNGMSVVPFAAAGLGWIAARNTVARPVLRGSLYGIGFLCVVIAGTAASDLALAMRITGGTSPLTQIHFLQTYDLAGALANDPSLELRQMDEDDPGLAKLMRSDAARLYTPERNDTLAGSAPLQKALLEVDDSTIPLQWDQFVREHPWLYLKVRWDAFRWVFFTPNLGACRAIFAGVSGPTDKLVLLGLSPRKDARDVALMSYAGFFTHTPVFSHAAYAALALALLVLFLRRRRHADIAMAFLLLSALAFALSFFLISIACDYRYLYALDLSALAAFFYAMLDWPKSAQ